MSAVSDLPLLDEHRELVAAGLPTVWGALLGTLEASRQTPARRRGARLLGCAELASNGRPFREIGATAPGFRVVESVPLSLLVLRGEHRFSEYALEFQLGLDSPSTTTLSARTQAAFPGIRGRLYRGLLVASRIHVAAVTATLRAVKRRAEANATHGGGP